MSLPRAYLVTFFLMVTALLGVLGLHLLPALLGGFVVYFAVEFGSHHISGIGIVRSTARVILLVFIALIIIALLATGIISLTSFVTHGEESLVSLMQRMADIVGAAKNYLPAWALEYLPTDVEEWQHTISGWLRGNAGYLSSIGKGLGITLVHILFGMIIGGLIAVTPRSKSDGVLARAMKERIAVLGTSFRRIVFSQCKISALNTTLTALFLGVVLPLTGNELPFLKTMIVITFVVGLLPVIGNLISNSVIFLIALSVSPAAGIASLVFLIVIHKLEYFFNAHIIGLQIKAQAWEILLAMLVLESLFGIPGLVAAPIYYAYLKDELSAQKMI